MGYLEFFGIAGLVTISAFLAGSEIALFSLSRFQLRALRETSRTAHKRIKKLLSDPSGLLVTILIANEFVNVSLSSMVASTVSRRWNSGEWRWTDLLPHAWVQNWPEWLSQSVEGLLISTPIILLFCEMTPKVIGNRLNQLIAPRVVQPLSFLYRIFKPVRNFLRRALARVSRGISELTDDEHHAESEVIKEDEFMVLVEEGQKEGTIHQTEVDLVRNVFNFDDTRVRDIFIPLSRSFTLQLGMKMDEVLAILRVTSHSRIPIFDRARKEIVGILYRKDVILDRFSDSLASRPLEEFMRKPFSVSTQMQINSLFRQMKNQKTHIAVVIDDKTSRPIGLVTMKDVLYELFDEYFPEKK